MNLPEKPEGDRETLTFVEHGIGFETMIADEDEMVNLTPPDEGHIDPGIFERLLDERGRKFARGQWRDWSTVLFAHRMVSVPLFDAAQGETYSVVRTDTHGRDDRPVLKRSSRFARHLRDSGKAVCMQYAITADKSPTEVCKEVPFDFFPSEVYRAREFVEEHDTVWLTHEDREWWERSPIGVDHELRGIMYFLYTLDDGDVVPRYIGLSRKYGFDDGELNWNFANINADSVFGRWGYGKNQHLGELSCAMWPDKYRWDPERKYEIWRDELFAKGRILREPLYIEVLPWCSDDLVIGEENLIRCASRAFPGKLLNTQYNDDDGNRALDEF